jgi:hypothetical protein
MRDLFTQGGEHAAQSRMEEQRFIIPYQKMTEL